MTQARTIKAQGGAPWERVVVAAWQSTDPVAALQSAGDTAALGGNDVAAEAIYQLIELVAVRKSIVDEQERAARLAQLERERAIWESCITLVRCSLDQHRGGVFRMVDIQVCAPSDTPPWFFDLGRDIATATARTEIAARSGEAFNPNFSAAPIMERLRKSQAAAAQRARNGLLARLRRCWSNRREEA